VADPHAQALGDLMSGVGESVTPDAVAWCLELLEDPRDRVVTGASLALENMGQISEGDDFWDQVAQPLAALFADSVEGSAQWEWLSHLLRLVPAEVRAVHGLRPTRPLAPLADVRDWTRSRLNSHWVDCQQRGVAIARRVGLGDEGLLARLVFDIALSPHETRAASSFMLVGALPEVAVLMGEQMVGLVEESTDPVIRARAARRLPAVLHGGWPDVAQVWLESADPDLRARGLVMAGAAGRPVSETVLDGALQSDDRIPALYAAGMTGHPVLDRWATDDDSDLSGAVSWWRRHGTRVVR
jgi:hypothetical protein